MKLTLLDDTCVELSPYSIVFIGKNDSGQTQVIHNVCGKYIIKENVSQVRKAIKREYKRKQLVLNL